MNKSAHKNKDKVAIVLHTRFTTYEVQQTRNIKHSKKE